MENPLKGLDRKELNRWAAVGGIGLVILVLSGIFSWPGATKTLPPTAPPTATDQTAFDQAKGSLETNLASALEKVHGAGKVQVDLTLSTGPTKDLSQRGNLPIGLNGAAVSGALVVADGAADPVVQTELTLGTATALGIPPYRVVVLPGKGG